MTSDDEREYTAARWLIDMDDTTFTEQQLAALKKWLRESDENCDTYLRLLRSMRRRLVLRRSELPLMYGTRPTGGQRSADTEAAGAPKRESRFTVPIDDVNKRLGAVVRDLRKAKGWSQERLATQARLARAYLSQLEMGSRSPTITTLMKISAALEVPASVLLKEMEASGD
jgi:XRE family transcriptional regulator, regulator of sulfur utilization